MDTSNQEKAILLKKSKLSSKEAYQEKRDIFEISTSEGGRTILCMRRQSFKMHAATLDGYEGRERTLYSQ